MLILISSLKLPEQIFLTNSSLQASLLYQTTLTMHAYHDLVHYFIVAHPNF